MTRGATATGGADVGHFLDGFTGVKRDGVTHLIVANLQAMTEIRRLSGFDSGAVKRGGRRGHRRQGRSQRGRVLRLSLNVPNPIDFR